MFEFGWSQVGGENHQRLYKWLPEREKRVKDRLVKAGWQAIKVHYDTGLLSGRAEIHTHIAATSLDSISRVIGDVRDDLFYQ